ncbi:hypothetical protein EIG52_08695, partial [Escherichia coli O109]|nr:hypothetical protein [Escherichia coli O109]
MRSDGRHVQSNDSARRGCERKTVTTEKELVSCVKERSNRTFEARYYVQNSNLQTVLEQGMVISRDALENYEAGNLISDILPQQSPEDAVLKMVDCLKRLGATTEANFKNNKDENVDP